MTIIERDIDFYEGQIEEERRRLARCPTSEEPMMKRRVERCAAVVAALKEYAAALPQTGTNPLKWSEWLPTTEAILGLVTTGLGGWTRQAHDAWKAGQTPSQFAASVTSHIAHAQECESAAVAAVNERRRGVPPANGGPL